MFVFAIWDSNERTLIVCRDRMGIKPLYYSEYKDRIYFASEIRGILVLSKIPREIDLVGLDAFLTVGFFPNPSSIYKGIRKLPPAHYLVVKAGHVSVRKYWELSYEVKKDPQDEREITEEFRHLLEESIKMHLMSEVPLGALLSGGIDSGTIVAIAQRVCERQLKTVSITFDSTHLNEGEAALETAQAIGTDHIPIHFTSDSMNDYPDALYFLEEPLAEPVFVTEYNMHRLCRQNGLTVVLTGEGADELLGGYHWHRGEIWARPFLKLPHFLRAIIAKGVLLRSQGAGSMAMYRILCDSPQNIRSYYQTWLTIGNQDMKKQILSADALSGIKNNGGQESLMAWDGLTSPVKNRPWCDQMLWLQSEREWLTTSTILLTE